MNAPCMMPKNHYKINSIVLTRYLCLLFYLAQRVQHLNRTNKMCLSGSLLFWAGAISALFSQMSNTHTHGNCLD